jgi:hypothetical protein
MQGFDNGFGGAGVDETDVSHDFVAEALECSSRIVHNSEVYIPIFYKTE